jgi:UDPglucose--hexose-1-phosphate uridylyltransferase
MPELRTDWLTGRIVLVAENRALRPNEFYGEPASRDTSLNKATPPQLPSCPFCAGNEHRTPPSVYEKLDGEGRWQVRVVPNSFPAVNNLSGETDGVAGFITSAEAVTSIDAEPSATLAVGAHEVFIESPRHIEGMAGLTIVNLQEVLRAYAERLRYWREEGHLHYGLVFKNQGPRAGASIAHVHSQLIALPFIPPTVAAELTRAAQQWNVSTRCAYCSLIEQERSIGTRIVIDDGGFVAFCPFASWQPHEVWLMAARHEPSFELIDPAGLDRLAYVLHRLFERLATFSSATDYNLLLRTAPWSGNHDNSYHWRIELLPRENPFAGCEVATGIYINSLPPERAAQNLRSA